MEFVDISYSAAARTDAQRQFDVYLPTDAVPSPPPPLLVFIHGGAWRAEDKGDHKKLARGLAAATRYSVAVVNYRLTPRDPPGDDHFQHPGHAEDLLDALLFLTTWQGPSAVGPVYNPAHLYLMGHSCSAHMLTSIFLDSSSITPSLTPTASLCDAVKAITLSEGIYDLELLLSDFPNYREWFIAPTFGRRGSYAPFSTTTFPLIATHIKWLIIHSSGDTLINTSQSERMYHHLCVLNGNEAPTRVFRNINRLSGDHNDVLLGLDYVDIVKDFVLNHA
ncbi:hypothetical protein H0H81_008831 [Sphagnurus paluster]|uniref:BD-FAE-like domain-containing protein n=1 Tax=Sphagnurus paluster TaxID=117069 RepID=A0A9P7GPN8_9AGAR|nr:hypothetical protein H0H81_008831 [Sphagnurus paluster]